MVLEAALDAFAIAGYANASMSAISARAGVSKAVLYDCFPDGKTSMFCAVLDMVEDGFCGELEDVLATVHARTPGQTLYEVIGVVFDYARTYPERWRLVFGDAGTGDRMIRERVRRARRTIVAVLELRLRAAARESGAAATPGVYRALAQTTLELARALTDDDAMSRADLTEVIVSLAGSDVPNEDARAS
jgi:AcrR family transcriptional regulator